MDKYMRLLALIDEYNESFGRAHERAFLIDCASVIGAEIDWDGWFANGFGCEAGYYPACSDA